MLCHDTNTKPKINVARDTSPVKERRIGTNFWTAAMEARSQWSGEVFH